ncbi:MAG: pyrimidine-nucleoside phosphorylase [Bacillota bacterium]
MRMYDIILKKRQGGELSPEELEFVIKGLVNGSVPDYQVSALLMAIFFNGLSRRETTDLTMYMYRSGDTVDLSELPGIKVDKHSTGGVGDKTTLVLAPLVASCGVTVAKMSGRGLGHTGGTIDKLESIPGFRVELSHGEFINQVRKIGLAIVAQTGNLVPADKKLYALRDVTATVDSTPLIASSVMSKKLASGADAIVLDVKAGRGAFMKTPEEAEELARLMVDIGKGLGRRVVALISAMDQPLGRTVGNALEVREAIQTLRGEGPDDLRDICLEIGSEMMLLAQKAQSAEEARLILEKNISSGRALDKFAEMIKCQGGNTAVLDNLDIMPAASKTETVFAGEDGFLAVTDAMKIGLSAMNLGAGRTAKDSKIDLGAGLVLHKKVGEKVKRGDPLATLYHNNAPGLEFSLELARQSFLVKDVTVPEKSILLKKIK